MQEVSVAFAGHVRENSAQAQQFPRGAVAAHLHSAAVQARALLAQVQAQVRAQAQHLQEEERREGAQEGELGEDKACKNEKARSKLRTCILRRRRRVQK